MTKITPTISAMPKHHVETIFNQLGDTAVNRARNLMARLRDPDTGCPWDVEQSFASIAPYTVEEAYEVNDAIQTNDMSALKEELGDLLLQVIFHARIGEEDGLFDFDQICDGLVRKMIVRHPHVFGDGHTASKNATKPTKVKTNWEALKEQDRKNKGQSSVLDGVAMALPALNRADKLQKRAARVGFDWQNAKQVLDKIQEEAAEIIDAQAQNEPQSRIHEEVGDLIFAVSNLARKLKVDPEHALRDCNAKFERRFHDMEASTERPLSDLDIDALETLWEQAKKKGL